MSLRSTAMIKKALMIVLFLTIPAMAFVAYAVYWTRNFVQATWGVEIGPLVYNAILYAGFALAIWITAGRFIKKLRAQGEKKERQSVDNPQ